MQLETAKQDLKRDFGSELKNELVQELELTKREFTQELNHLGSSGASAANLSRTSSRSWS